MTAHTLPTAIRPHATAPLTADGLTAAIKYLNDAGISPYDLIAYGQISDRCDGERSLEEVLDIVNGEAWGEAAEDEADQSSLWEDF